MPPKKKTRVIASALPSLKHCPAYEGSRVSGPPAIFGTAFHKAVETGELKHALTKEAVQAAADGQGYTEVEIEQAFIWSMDLISGLEEKYKPAISKAEVQGNLEGRRFFIDHLMIIMPEGDGPRTAIVIDWKTGRMMMDAMTNLQGLAYVREILSNEAYGVDTCSMMFAHPFVESYSHAVFDMDCLPKIHEELEAVIKEAKMKNPPQRPGEGCKYCGLHPCAAVSKKIKEVADGSIDMERAAKEPEYMSELRDLVVPLEKFVKDIKAAANAMRFDEGLEIPGYSCVFMKQRTRVEEPAKVLNHLLETLDGLDLEHVLSYCSPTLKALQSMIGDTVEKGKRGEVYSELEAHCRQLGWITGGEGDGTAYLKKTK